MRINAVRNMTIVTAAIAVAAVVLLAAGMAQAQATQHAATDDIQPGTGQAQAPPGILSITYIEMGGSGDATLIQAPDGSNILVDAGDRFKSRYQEVKSVLEQNNVDVIDLAIATHGDADHVGGFNHLLEDSDYTVNEIWFMDTAKTTATVEKFLTLSAGIRTHVSAGQAESFDGMTIEVLSPPTQGIGGDENANSIVSLLEYGDLELLFTGDATEATESWLVNNVPSDKLDIDIMNAPHHGSIKTSNTQAFITATSPELVIFSADEDNRYGHPHKETRDRYTSNDVDQLQTGRDGHVNIRTDGTKCSILFTDGTEIACFEGVSRLSDVTPNRGNQDPPQQPPGIAEPQEMGNMVRDIPDWVRQTAEWWVQGLIPDEVYIQSLEYLIKVGIINVGTS